MSVLQSINMVAVEHVDGFNVVTKILSDFSKCELIPSTMSYVFGLCVSTLLFWCHQTNAKLGSNQRFMLRIRFPIVQNKSFVYVL